jgi:glycerol-3-phosphate dehydrogenase
MVDQAFIRTREPHVAAKTALFSPNTGILEAEALVRTLAGSVPNMTWRCCPDRRSSAQTPAPTVWSFARAPSRSWRRTVVNAAGLYADEVSAMLDGQTFRIYPCRGEYVELVPSKRGPGERARLPAATHAWPRRPPHEDHGR